MNANTHKFRSAYDSNRSRVSLSFIGEDGSPELSRTEQCHSDLCDINNILSNYDRTGLITHVNATVGEYGDFTEVNEYQEALNLTISANQNFMKIPASIRKEFNNDAGAFYEFASNPANQDRMVELGLAYPPKKSSQPPEKSGDKPKPDETKPAE